VSKVQPEQKEGKGGGHEGERGCPRVVICFPLNASTGGLSLTPGSPWRKKKEKTMGKKRKEGDWGGCVRLLLIYTFLLGSQVA